jgi:hypothetical protein
VAENLSIESPDFEAIRKEAGITTSDAVQLLWEVLNYEIAQRRKTVRDAKEVDEGKVSVYAQTANTDNYDDQRASIIEFTGSASINFTGIRNGIEGRRITLHNIGTGTITLKHNTTSDSANRLFNDTGADKSLTQNSSIVYLYLNGSWKELNLL